MSIGIDFIYYIVTDNYIIRVIDPPKREELPRKVEPIRNDAQLGKYLDTHV